MDKKNFSCTNPVLRRGKDGRWYLEVYYELPGNVRYRKKIYAGINREIDAQKREQLASRLIANFNPEIFFPNQKKSLLSELPPRIKEYIEDHQQEWKKTTVKSYRQQIKLFCKWCQENIPNVPVEKLKLMQARQFMKYLAEERKAGRTTWNKYRATLREMYSRLRVKYNPFDEIKIFPESKNPKKSFTDFELKKLWKYVVENDPEMEIAFGLIYYCFLRPPGEILQLRIHDIHFSQQEIYLDSMQSKSNRKRRHAIPFIFLEKLEKFRHDPGNWYLLGNKLKPSLIKCDHKYFYLRLRGILNHLNFGSGYSAYSLRHTGAINLYQQSRDIYLVKNAMQHSTVSTTEKYLRNLGSIRDERLFERKAVM